MNIFYAPPDQISGAQVELRRQEAKHASKVLRYREGDDITVVDGQGGWYEGTVSQITNKSVLVSISASEKKPVKKPRLILGLGIIKKRDRLEFAVEKAVELGVAGIALFRGDHTIKQNVRMDRLQATVLRAMKQSMQAWLPQIGQFSSVAEVIEAHPQSTVLAAHEKVEASTAGIDLNLSLKGELLLLVGPEGGFSDNEIEVIKDREGQLISLGGNRLRTETAAVVFLSQFI